MRIAVTRLSLESAFLSTGEREVPADVGRTENRDSTVVSRFVCVELSPACRDVVVDEASYYRWIWAVIIIVSTGLDDDSHRRDGIKKFPAVPVVASFSARHKIAALATFTFIVASLITLRKDHLKRRLAYSTISQLSYIVMGLALLTPYGVTGGLLHIPDQQDARHLGLNTNKRVFTALEQHLTVQNTETRTRITLSVISCERITVRPPVTLWCWN